MHPEFKGGLVLDTENSTYMHSSHWVMLLPSSRAACPDVEEIMLLFDIYWHLGSKKD